MTTTAWAISDTLAGERQRALLDEAAYARQIAQAQQGKDIGGHIRGLMLLIAVILAVFCGLVLGTDDADARRKPWSPAALTATTLASGGNGGASVADSSGGA
jgi:hypothetical protein